jgi:hypothetical protein
MAQLKAALGDHGMIKIAGKKCAQLSCFYANLVHDGMTAYWTPPWGATEAILCNDVSTILLSRLPLLCVLLIQFVIQRPDTIQPNGAYIISYIQDLVNQCTYKDTGVKLWETGGQAFDTDNYNVIVKWTAQGCPA